jgi:hypothetical protein
MHNCSIATTRQATKSTMMAMAQWDTTTMFMATDVYDDKDNTASCEAAVHQEAEAGPSIRNNQTMRGENGRKLATTMPGTVTMPPSTTTSTTSMMATVDDATLDDDNNVDDSDGATGIGDDGDGGGATSAAVVDDDDGSGYEDDDGATTATVTATARRCCA